MRKIDFHVHCIDCRSVEQSATYLEDMIVRKGYRGVCIQGLIHCTGAYYENGNEIALKLSKMLPDSYAFAGLDHGRDFIEQTKEYMARGFRGIKLLDGKPSEWRQFGYSYDDQRFDEFFAFCEVEKIPLMIHNNDPKDNWDVSKATKRAMEQGWVYDENVPSQEWFFEQLENVLLRYSNLRAALAHFGFYADNIQRAERLMEKCPYLMMDITPAICIYPQLSKNPKKAEAFFRKYHERIIYGTDADCNLVGFAREYNDLKVDIITHFLEGKEPKAFQGEMIHPIKLETEMLENIYYNNAMRFIIR